MSQGLRTRGSLINLDAAEVERKARIARDAMGDPFGDEELMRLMREEERDGARMLAAAVVVAVFVASAALLWAMPDIVAWMVGAPSIVVTVR